MAELLCTFELEAADALFEQEAADALFELEATDAPFSFVDDDGLVALPSSRMPPPVQGQLSMQLNTI